MANAIFFDPKTESQVKRKRAVAQKLMEYGKQPEGTEMISGIAVKRSPWESLAKALSTGVAGYAEGAANRLETEDTEKKQKALADAVAMYQSDPQAAAQILMQSPSTAEYGLKLGIPALSSGSSSTPAPMQIANQMYSLEQTMNNPNLSEQDRFNAQRQYNLLGQAAKTYGFDRGMEVNSGTFAPPMGQPQTPMGNLPLSNSLPSGNPPAQGGFIDKPEFMEMPNPPESFASILPKPQPQANIPIYGAPKVGSIAGYDQTMANREAMKAGFSQQAEKDVDLQMNPQIKGMEARAAASGKEAGTAEGALEKKYITAPQMNSLIQEAEKLLPVATGSWYGRREKGINSLTGASTDASKADKQLNVIAAALTGNVPRFEGPQGVLDVELYKQAAGDLSNPEIPRDDRIAALKTIKSLNDKYMTPQADGTAPNVDYKSKYGLE
jgi:hypothetical protein